MPATTAKQSSRKSPLDNFGNKLRQWKKGESGNKGGRRQGPGITDALFVIMKEIDPKSGLSGAQAIARATFKLAVKGHPIALREVWERVEGKVAQVIDVNVESQLWQRLNQGRLRVSAVKESVTLQAPGGAQVTIERTTTDQQLAELDNTLTPDIISIESVSPVDTESS